MTRSPVPGLSAELGSLVEAIDARLAEYCDLPEGTPPRLREAMEYVLLAPGKRIRPSLVLMACQACGGDLEAALPAACAVEMIHTYSLVHDDLPAMDDDDLRRGRPTCHVVFGEANAILTGDALLAYALEIVARDVRPGELAARCTAALARAAGPSALVGGQWDDLAAEDRPVDLPDLQAIHRRKTGAMLTVSLVLGGMIGGADDDRLARLESFGERLGLAFQITDDLLDSEGQEDVVGKRTGKDAGRNKSTYPRLLGVQASRDKAAGLIAQACELLEPFGERGGALRGVARFVLERNQ